MQSVGKVFKATGRGEIKKLRLDIGRSEWREPLKSSIECASGLVEVQARVNGNTKQGQELTMRL